MDLPRHPRPFARVRSVLHLSPASKRRFTGGLAVLASAAVVLTAGHSAVGGPPHTAATTSPVVVQGLQTDGRPTPLGIDDATPEFSCRTGVQVPVLGAARRITEDGTLVWDGQRAVGGALAHLSHGYVVFAHVTGSHQSSWAG